MRASTRSLGFPKATCRPLPRVLYGFNRGARKVLCGLFQEIPDGFFKGSARTVGLLKDL